jgi:hypothetical protein
MKVTKTKPVKMEKREFVSEHRKLVRILKTGSQKQRVAEAKKQSAELKEKE